MKKWTRNLLTGLAAFTLAIGGTACSSGKSDSSSAKPDGTTATKTAEQATKAPEGKKVKLEYWHTYSDAEEKILVEQIKPLFEKEHPNIELNLTRMPTEGLKQQVIAGVSGGAAPDLMRMDIVWVPEFAKMGALQELSARSDFNDVRSTLFDGSMETNYYNGKYYGLPVNTNTKIALWNKKLLQDAGLSEPPKTIDEMVAAARTLKGKGIGKGYIGLSGTSIWSMAPYFWSLGGVYTNEDYTKAEGFLNGPASVKALETIVGWQKEGLIIPTALGGEPGVWDGFNTDEYMMIDDGPWFYSILMNDDDKSRDPLDYAIRTTFPAGVGGSHSVIGGEDLVMFAGSKHPEEAWTFMKWMMTKEPQILMAQTGLIPTNKDAASDPKVQATPFIKEFTDQLNTALPRTPIAAYGEMEDIVNKAFEKALRGEGKPKAVLDEAAKAVETVMHQN
ncbi:extracellular solute-binding protein [Gorillibacterium massiliense]|uniref:extracellular solute-binding protein n=1 Tax=Gorillibacterium massiliense TaxID=1280390 RepID=UPI0006932610|nr:extracellular solute-binding protein [Gorillibacterium massiliense]